MPDLLGKAFTLAAHGEVSFRMARLNQGRQQVQRALLIFQNQGNKWGQAYSNRVLGMLAVARGESHSAAGHFRDGIRHCTPQDVEHAHCLRELGHLALIQGNKIDAKKFLRQALDIYVMQDYPSGREQIEKLMLETVEFFDKNVPDHLIYRTPCLG
jgi:tetratricopeptide (TPR) repeat protein